MPRALAVISAGIWSHKCSYLWQTYVSTSSYQVKCKNFSHWNWQVFYSLTNNLSTRRRTVGAIIERLGNAIIQLFNQAVIHNPKNVSTNPAVLRTETPETTQDIQIETKNINVICPYLAGIIAVLLMFFRGLALNRKQLLTKKPGINNENLPSL